jgi:hypothetical protein
VLAGGIEGLARVVTDGAPRLSDGQAVRVVDEPRPTVALP